jgi:hypothetical protein
MCGEPSDRRGVTASRSHAFDSPWEGEGMGEPHAGERRYKDVLRCCNILYAESPQYRGSRQVAFIQWSHGVGLSPD